MVGRGVRKAKSSHRPRKRAGRRPRGIQVKERSGTWHAYGVVRLAGGRAIRVRQGLGLSVERYTEGQAQDAALELEQEIRARAAGKIGRGGLISVAALDYLKRPRERPLKPESRRIVKKMTEHFGPDRRLNEIPESDWFHWIDGDPAKGSAGVMTGRKSSTRERMLNTVVAFLNYCKTHHGLAKLPAFWRDRKATSPTRRAKRRVDDLRTDLIQILLINAHPAIRAQLAVEIATGARVSSIMRGARICDLILAPSRETIIFRGTKSGLDVAAALSPSAAAELKIYLAWRGDLHDREAPLFLTPARQPYVDNGGRYGTQNKTGFNRAKERAAAAIRKLGAAIAGPLRHVDRPAAAAASAAARADAALLGKVTQHWFRHRMARLWLRKDPRAAMDQGGWLDIQSVLGYSDDVPEFRSRVAAELDAFAAAPPRRSA